MILNPLAARQALSGLYDAIVAAYASLHETGGVDHRNRSRTPRWLGALSRDRSSRWGWRHKRRRRGLSPNPTLGAGIRCWIARTIFRLCRSTLSYGFSEVGRLEPASRPRGLLCHSFTSMIIILFADKRCIGCIPGNTIIAPISRSSS